MNLHRLILALALLSAGGVSAGTNIVLDVDCARATAPTETKGVGRFRGVMPVGFGENFTGWSEADVTSVLTNAGGRTFIRFDSANDSTAQFATYDLSVKLPGVFRFTIRARTTDEPVTCVLRKMGAPYTAYWTGNFLAPEGKEQSLIFDCPSVPEGKVGFFLIVGRGVTEVERFRLEEVPESLLEAQVKRPPRTTREYLGHTRFPLGLPSRWSEAPGNFIAATKAEAGSLRICPFGLGVVDSEPFQVCESGVTNTVTVRYRAPVGENWKVSVVNDLGLTTASCALPRCGEFREARFTFVGRPRDIGFALRFSGNGCLYLDEAHAFPGVVREPGETETAEVALAMSGGELAERCRLVFDDEPGKVRFACVGAPAGATLRIRAVDFYGRTRQLPDRPAAAEGEFAFDPFPDVRLGQFRVEAWIESAGRRVSPVEEMVFTRLERPLHWNEDAPDSPFGGHMTANARIIDLCKASGVNWARLHDAGTEYCGWWMMEPEKGKLQFFDEEIERYRRRHVLVFAQMGTTPAWASHFHELGLKHMGYFERYLRPKSNDEFVRYVKDFATHHRGRINHYFFWNEPWGPWWVSAKDAKFYDPARTTNDFAELTRRVYTALKEVDPGIVFSGYNSNEGKVGAKWAKAMTDDDVFNHCDVIDYHYYTSRPRLVHGRDKVTSASTVAAIEVRHPGHGGKEIWMGEGQGTSEGTGGVRTRVTGLYRRIPWGAETKEDLIETADYTARYTISILAEGVSKVFLYSQHAWKAMIIKPTYLTLAGADGYPGVSNAAHAHMARMLEGRRFVRDAAYGRNGGCWRFEGRGGVCEVYDGLDAAEMLELAKRPGAKVTDLFGNPVTAETAMPGTVVYAESVR